MSSLVCALPSPASAEGRPSLFGWFIGTTAQSGLLLHVHVRRSVYGLRGPVLIRRPRRAGDLPVLVHVVSQACAGFLDYAGPTNHSRLTWLSCCLPPYRNGVGILFQTGICRLNRPTDTSVYASSETSRSRLQDSRPGWIRCSLFL